MLLIAAKWSSQPWIAGDDGARYRSTIYDSHGQTLNDGF